MRFVPRFNRWWLALFALGLVVWGAYAASAWWRERNRVVYREEEVTRGDIVAVVNSTGTLHPTRSVQVGSFVSGPILDVFVDFNTEVKPGTKLAKIDPQIYDANVNRDKATLATREAEVLQITAQRQRAINDRDRSLRLRELDPAFISDSEMDQYRYGKEALDAQLSVALALAKQAKATLEQSEANLEYTNIKSPVDGIIIDRKVDPGQTVASQFQTPELFVIAVGMRQEMHVFASVDEADIGLVRSAQQEGLPVTFTVDAYPDDLFTGKIYQVRKNSTTTQNVVTYPVVVSAPNPELKLLPGMTASISFQVGEAKDVLRIPNAALRFYPERAAVHPDDRTILDGNTDNQDEEALEQAQSRRSAEQKAELRRNRNRRHVWIKEGPFLRAIEVVTGLSDSEYTEVKSGDLKVGQQLITGTKSKRP